MIPFELAKSTLATYDSVVLTKILLRKVRQRNGLEFNMGMLPVMVMLRVNGLLLQHCPKYFFGHRNGVQGTGNGTRHGG